MSLHDEVVVATGSMRGARGMCVEKSRRFIGCWWVFIYTSQKVFLFGERALCTLRGANG